MPRTSLPLKDTFKRKLFSPLALLNCSPFDSIHPSNRWPLFGIFYPFIHCFKARRHCTLLFFLFHWYGTMSFGYLLDAQNCNSGCCFPLYHYTQLLLLLLHPDLHQGKERKRTHRHPPHNEKTPLRDSMRPFTPLFSTQHNNFIHW